MVKSFGIALLFTLILPSAVLAQSVTPKVRDQSARIAQIKSRSDGEIERRLASLNSASTKIGGAKKLSTDDKNKFSAQIQTAITNLNTLKIKIDADSDLETLRTDAKTIFTDFRVYAVLLPQVHELAAIDAMGVSADNLSTIADKLEARITVDADKTLLADMRAKIADAKTQYSAVESEVSALTPASFPGSTATLKDARAKIKTGAADLRTALQDARKIRSDLK